MPKSLKIKKLLKGKNVKPPKKWFVRMVKIAKKTYPLFPQARLLKVVAGIWHKLPKKTKVRLVKKYG